MTLARRLLMAGGGSGAFTLPLQSMFTLLSGPNGGIFGNAITPCSFYYNGVVYFAFYDGSGHVKASSYNLATTVTSIPVTLWTTGSVDSHASPSIIVRQSDHRLVVASSDHDGSTPYISISTNPEDATAFGSSTAIAAQTSGSDFTYMKMVQLAGEAGAPIYLFYRDIVGGYGRIAYSKSTDGGVTWSAAVILATASGASGQVLYTHIASDWNTRIEVWTTNNDRSIVPASIYHMYYQSGAWHKTDGTVISVSLPMAPSDMTLVWAPSTVGADIGVPALVGGVPAGLFGVLATPTQLWTARWRSGAWQTNQVMAGDINATGMGDADPDTVYVGKKVGSFYEVFVYTTGDDGATWTGTQLTAGSASDSLMISVPHNAPARLRALWGRGTKTSDYVFNGGTEGYG